MTRANRTSLHFFVLGFALAAPLVAQSGKTAADPPGEWHNYNRDLPSSRYSPLSQIDRTNVGKLALAFRWRPDSSVAPREFKEDSAAVGTARVRDSLTAGATGETSGKWRG